MSKLTRVMQHGLGFAFALCLSAGCAHNSGEQPPPADNSMSTVNGSTAEMASDAGPSMAADDNSAGLSNFGARQTPADTQPGLSSDGTQSMANATPGISNQGMQPAANGTSAGVVTEGTQPVASNAPSDSSSDGDQTLGSDRSQSISNPRNPESTASNSGDDDSTPVSSEAALDRLHVFSSAEIPIARLAAHSTNPAIATFASRMVRDHKTDDRKIALVAKSLKVSLDPASMTDTAASQEMNDDAATLESLRGMHGSDFDAAFSKHMRVDRHEAVASVRALRKSCSEPRVCKLIDRILPGFEDELSRALALPGGDSSASNP